jgi:hypothetical protein
MHCRPLPRAADKQMPRTLLSAYDNSRFRTLIASPYGDFRKSNLPYKKGSCFLRQTKKKKKRKHKKKGSFDTIPTPVLEEAGAEEDGPLVEKDTYECASMITDDGSLLGQVIK